ncbi:DUF881 domain-containing protein [Aneurinibacillus tyrosinisolvens]|uniref:DUF881 domain-containing protein n=1 Tax=Aneurinibacillus tyrosinisolvens TaxID=1443435 RepID=UPI00063EDAB3|nr:DUF881 domain-containing protein [Aneurinibacillus tyrosinisolvens]
MKKNLSVRRIHVYLTLVLLIFGFIVAYSVQFTQYQGKSVAAPTDSEWEKKVKLNEKIIQEKEANDQLEERLQKIRVQVSTKERELSERQVVSKQVLNELEQMRMQAGFVPVIGQGVTVTLDDSKTAREFSNVADGIVHDQNIRDVVNELFAAGAEGIAVNDQRLVGGSSVRCVGPTVIVNDSKLAPPFVVSAIGNKDTLLTALKMPGGVIDSLKQRTIEISIKDSEQIELPGYIGGTGKNAGVSLPPTKG